MLISHSLKTIFIKTRKTAGSSFERYIYENHFDPDHDILTGSKIDGTPWVNIPSHVRGHMDWEQIRNLIKVNGHDWWDTYTKVTIERNPWDKVVSQFWFFRKQLQKPDAMIGASAWEAFNYGFIHGAVLDKNFPNIDEAKEDLQMSTFEFEGFKGGFEDPDNPFKDENMPKDWHRYSDQNGPVVDRMIKYETLADDFDAFLKTKGESLDIEKWLSINCKSGFREDDHYSEMYHPANIKIIGEYFHEEVENLGYVYESKVHNR